MLRGAVSRHERHCDVPGGAGDVDNGSARLFPHHWNDELHGTNGAEQVGIEHATALIHVHGLNCVHESVASVVHPNIYPLEVFESLGQEIFDISALGDITGHGHAALETADTLPG